ncbi:MFS transporter [Erysipelatoclostridium sp. An15]|uniref:MFS transporter n=1 Tax=Erysipelatoclostridium sp. An15 TaxID=1965566 RepID=UPI000B38B37E|nr:MFS transporter [Erysipelatoclostridium sp. An15]OUQ08885.1 MFS transporter [Erysipelatoclostridium sp. An15]
MKKEQVLKYSLLSASLLVGSAPAINANIPAMASAFDTIPLAMIEMLTTVPSLFLMISVLISSFIAKKIGYKQTASLGLLIVAVSGILPVFVSNFYLILISRAMLGFGIGLFNSLTVALVNSFYQGKDRAKMYGLQSAFEGAGGIFITFIAGQLLKIGWQAPFLAYAIAIPVCIVFIKFIPKVATANDISVDKNVIVKENRFKKDNIMLISFIALLFVAASLYMTMGIKVSTLITTAGYGNASDASLVIILLSLGAITAGTLFSKIIKIFKQLTPIIGLLILALAMFLIGISNSMIITFAGGFLTGFGFKIFMPYLIGRINNSQIKNTPLATSLLLVGFNLGAFISPYSSIFMQNIALSDSLNRLFIVLSGGFICLAVIMLVLNNIFTNKEVNYVSMELADN